MTHRTREENDEAEKGGGSGTATGHRKLKPEKTPEPPAGDERQKKEPAKATATPPKTMKKRPTAEGGDPSSCQAS